MKLYHGTSSRLLPRILKRGLEPRGKRKGNWQHTVDSNPNAVYLTNAYALYYASCAMKTHRAVILEVDTNKLNPFCLAPDEDFLEAVSRKGGQFPHIEGKPMKERVAWFRDRLAWFSVNWEESLKVLGNCTYLGTVPPHAITRYVVLPWDRSRIVAVCDPTITVMNYTVMGEYYRQLSGFIFGEPVDPDKCISGGIMLAHLAESGEKLNIQEVVP